MKRCFDLILAGAGLIVASPVLAILAALIFCLSGPPVFFRQVRIGRGGREFRLCKFRTMEVPQAGCALGCPQQSAGAGLADSAYAKKELRYNGARSSADSCRMDDGFFDAGDISRVTPVGRMLRRWKLDELPQLWNVLTGDMSLVGPRPEVRKWVDAFPERWARVLTVRPGITDPASIIYRHEEDILTQSPDPQQTYRDTILPHKLSLCEDYVRNRTFWGDIKILLKTLRAAAACEAMTVRSPEIKIQNS